MKILHVLPALTKGGAERVAVELANHAASAGHDVTMVAAVPAEPRLLADRLDDRVRLMFVMPAGRKVRPAYARIVPWIFRHRGLLFDQDVIHCHLSFGATFGAVIQALRALARRRTPVVVETYHAVGMAIPGRNRAIHAMLLKPRDGVALIAEDCYWRGFAAKARPRLVRTIPNGLPQPRSAKPDAAARYAERIGLPRDPLIVGSIGRLSVDRRPELLLETFAQLVRITPHDVHLLLGGEGSERGRLKMRAKSLGLGDRVHLPGLVEEPGEALASINIYLTVNVGATTGIAAFEAAGSGVPVVAIQLDGDYPPAADDWIWSSADPKAVAAHLAELMDNPRSLAELARKQQAHVRAHHDIETMARAYDRLYEDALAGRGER